MARGGRGRLILSLCAATLATIAAVPRPHANVRGVSYLEHHIKTSSGMGLMAAIAAPRSEYTELVVFAAGRVRRELVTGMATQSYAKGDYTLGDRISGVIVVDPASHTFEHLFNNLDAPALTAGAAPANRGAPPGSMDVHASLDTLGAGDVIDGHATEHYRVNESYSVFETEAQQGCRTRTSSGGSLAPADAPMVSRSTVEYWLTPAAEGLTSVRELLAVDGALFSTGAISAEQSSFVDPVRGNGVMGEVLSRLHAMEGGMPRDRIALRTVTTVVTNIGVTGEQTRSMDTTQISDIHEVDVDASRLLLPDGFTEAKTVAPPSTRPTAVQAPDASAPWHTLPSARPASGASPITSRRFTIFPAVRRQTTWDLDVDGELNLGVPGRWIITPQASFTATTLAWGGGGGSARTGNGAGGGGGFTTGTISFQAGVSYTLLVADGGKGSVERNGNCGGDGGFGGGGAGGGVQTGGEGDPGMPFSSGGDGYLGDGAGAGSAGGGGGLSGVLSGPTLDRAGALLIAGGGGGGTFGAIRGGAGGGATGETGTGVEAGAGATQSEGGAAGTDGDATPGSDGAGGGGGFATGRGAGGGGGGGYFGGGGGGQNRGGGGGGSGFVAATVSGGSTEGGRGNIPGNWTDPRNGGAGIGATATGTDGAPGRIIIIPR